MIICDNTKYEGPLQATDRQSPNLHKWIRCCTSGLQ